MPQTSCKSGISLYPWVRPRRAPSTQLSPLPWQMGSRLPGLSPQSSHRSGDTPVWHTWEHPLQGQRRG